MPGDEPIHRIMANQINSWAEVRDKIAEVISTIPAPDVDAEKVRSCVTCVHQRVCSFVLRYEKFPNFVKPDSWYLNRRWIEDARICKQYTLEERL